MRFDLYLDVRSLSDAVAFYVDELGLFELAQDFGMHNFLLRAKGNWSIGMHLGERDGQAAVFGIRVADCARLFERLKHTVFASGALIESELTRWAFLNTLVMRDPSGNRVVLFDEVRGDTTPRLELFLRVRSVRAAITFYVEELGWFDLAGDMGANDYLLLSNRDDSLALHISETKGDPAETPMFAISEKCVDREYARMAGSGLKSGATLVPDHAGNLGVLDWPGGKNFELNDPSGNKVLIFEDYIVPAGD